MVNNADTDQAGQDALQEHMLALQAWMEQQGIKGPHGVQVALLWAAMVLRDQAHMPELAQACYETALAATQLYHARAAAVAQQRN